MSAQDREPDEQDQQGRPLQLPKKDILEALSQLPSRQQEVLTLFFSYDLTPREAAERLGEDVTAIYRLKRDALTNLRNILDIQTAESLSKVGQDTKFVGKAVEEISVAATTYEENSPELARLQASYEQLSASVMKLQETFDRYEQLSASVMELRETYDKLDDQVLGFAEHLPDPKDIWPQKIVQEKFTLLEENVKRLEEEQRAREEEQRERQSIVLARWQVWLGVAALVLATALAILQWLGYL